MKKHLFAPLLALLLAALAGAAAAQEYYTLPEVREQAAQGWHQTYTDAMGRTIPVDVEVEVFGEDAAPVLKVKPSQTRLNADLLDEGAVGTDDSGVSIHHNNPANYVFQTKGKEQPLIVFHSYGEKVDMDAVYMPEYGAVCTMREMTDCLRAILERQGIPTEDYVYDQPKDFSVRCKVRKDTGEVVEPAIYLAHFWQKMYGLPVLAHAGSAFMNAVWPLFSPQSVFGMRREDEYSIAVQSVDETEVLARDVPLCSFEQVKRGVEQLIESGHVRRIFDVRLGLVVYNDPDRDKKARSTFDLNYYLAPAWVVNCIYMDSSKAEFAYGAVPADELVRDEKNVPEYCPIILNAQTGEPLNRADKGGDSRADFKGFISWDDVK